MHLGNSFQKVMFITPILQWLNAEIFFKDFVDKGQFL